MLRSFGLGRSHLNERGVMCEMVGGWASIDFGEV